MISLYGLKNCDTCRKARRWLDARGTAHAFHDVRADGISAALIAGWIAAVGWETLLNRRGTTWRGLAATDKDGVDEAKAAALMAAHPALIKRPVIDTAGTISVGFAAAQHDALAARLDG